MRVGKPWPVISFHVSPSSVDLKSIVPVGPCCGSAAAAASAAGASGAWRAVVAHGRREHHARMIERPRDLLRARRAVDVERLLPILSAVGAPIHAAHVRERVDVALRREQHEVRILRVDEDRRNLLRVVESPSASTSRRRPSTCRRRCSFVDAAAGDQVAHADVDDVRIRRRDLNAADGRRLLHVVEDRIPRRARARRLPDAASGSPM